MTTAYEESFARALEAEVPDLGELPPEFFTTVTSRARQHRRWRTAVMAAGCALAVAIGGGAVAAPLWVGHHPPPGLTGPAALTPVALADRIPDWAKLPSVDSVWPNAIRRLPVRLPDNSQYALQALLPGNRYLVLEMAPWEAGYRMFKPEIFDPAARTLTPLGDPKTPPDFVEGVGVIGDRAVWVNPIGGANNPTGEEIWSAPLRGGPARKLISLRSDYKRENGLMVGAGPGSFTIAGNYVMWERLEDYAQHGQLARRTTIYRLPVTGGQPELVPASQGFQLSQVYSGFGGTTAVATKGTQTSGVLLDLISGATLPWKLSAQAPAPHVGTSHVDCGLLGCVGNWDNPGGEHGVVQQTDGGGWLALQGSVEPAGDGRFVVYSDSSGVRRLPNFKMTGVVRVAIWDRVTGKAALCYSRNLADQGSLMFQPDEYSRGFVTWEDHGSLVVLDLQAMT
jgi:hypothetical protein